MLRDCKVAIMRPEITGKKVQIAEVSNPTERLTYTIDEAAKALGISRALAYRKGVLPTVQIAGRRLVPKAALDRMLAQTV
jgi:excisionase family DNA binding protein